MASEDAPWNAVSGRFPPADNRLACICAERREFGHDPLCPARGLAIGERKPDELHTLAFKVGLTEHRVHGDKDGILFLKDLCDDRCKPAVPAQRTARVQGFSGGIPWAMHLRAWDNYAERYGRSQSAERLHERGGFGTGELDMFLPGWREELDDRTKMRARITQLETELVATRSTCDRLNALSQLTKHEQAIIELVRRAIFIANLADSK